MNIGIIGANGFLGKKIADTLKHNITHINKENYFTYVNKKFDVLINANGNSRKYWAIKNPHLDFIASVTSVYNSISDFKFNVYIYISSVDVFQENIYGLHKHHAEKVVIEKCKKFLILRCCSIIGENMKKGILKDIIENKKLFVTPDSKLQFITNTEIAKVINFLIKKNIYNKIYTVAGIKSIEIKKLEKIFNKKFEYNEKIKKQIYNEDVNKLNKIYKLKTSEQYVKEIVK